MRSLAPWLVVTVGLAALRAQVQYGPVTGVVLEAGGAPAVGAEIELWRADGPDLRRLALDRPAPWRRVGRARTDRDGHFGLQGPLGVLCQLRIEHAGAASHRETFRPACGEERVQLQPPCVLQGQVRCADGARPVAARLTAWLDGMDPVTITTDGEGRYRWERLPPGPLRLAVVADGCVEPRQEWPTLVAGQAVQYSPSLLHGGVLRGTVVDDATGQPLAGAELRMNWWGPTRARSDAQGAFAVAGVGGQAAQLHCLVDGYVRAVRAVGEPLPEAMPLRMLRGTTVSGLVQDERGRPIQGAQVWSLGDESSTQSHFHWLVPGTTDAAGAFSTTGSGHDEQIPTLVVTAVDRAMVVYEGQQKGLALAWGPVTLPRGRLLRGVATDAAGRPVGGVTVGLWGGNDDRWRRPEQRARADRAWHGLAAVVSWRFTRTDASGCFAFGELPPGTYDLEFRGERGVVLEVRRDLVVAADDQAPLRVTLPR